MRTLITFLALVAISLTTNAQNSIRVVEIDSVQFEIETARYPDGRGSSWDSETLYYVTATKKELLPLMNKWKESILLISDMQMTKSEGPNGTKMLTVSYFCQLGIMKAAFVLVGDEWVDMPRMSTKPRGYSTN